MSGDPGVGQTGLPFAGHAHFTDEPYQQQQSFQHPTLSRMSESSASTSFVGEDHPCGPPYTTDGYPSTSSSSMTTMTQAAPAAPKEKMHEMYNQATSSLMGETASTGSVNASDLAAQSDKARRVLHELGRELVCSICTEVFVEASTLECGHTFCGPCIQNWLSMHTLSCPLCRSEVTTPPTRSMCLDKMVKALVQLADEESARTDLLSREHRCWALRNKETAAQKELEVMLARAARAGFRVVSITDVWNEREQGRFQRGIAKLTGLARQSFCNCVGLTKEWISRALPDQLAVALTNLKLCPSVEAAQTYCPNRVRCRLDMFVRYG